MRTVQFLHVVLDQCRKRDGLFAFLDRLDFTPDNLSQSTGRRCSSEDLIQFLPAFYGFDGLPAGSILTDRPKSRKVSLDAIPFR